MENVRLFLGMFVLSFVSGDTVKQVSSCLGGSVVLPCPCEKRDTSTGFYWQKMNAQDPLKVFKLADKNQTYGKYFEGRVDFFEKNESDCSISLKNITLRDHGNYRCFYRTNIFEYINVNLNVYGATNATQTGGPDISCPEARKLHTPKEADRKLLWMVPIFVVIVLVLLLSGLILCWKCRGQGNQWQQPVTHRPVP